MKALTIHQPFAELIARLAKRVENRTWVTHDRVHLAIHAGTSTSRRNQCAAYGLELDDLARGAIVAVAELVDCVRLDAIDTWPPELAWLETHEHAEGPVCLVLADVRRLAEPVPCQGRQSLWNVGDEELAAIERQIRNLR